MTIQRYSREEMTAITSTILNKKAILLPIGNHELKRHLVYKVKTDDGDFVFKYYYQHTYGGREISTLRLLEGSGVKHPKLIDYGTFGEDREWLTMNLLQGMPFDKIIDKISEEDKLQIFKDMGIELAKIHELKVFDYFGNFTEDLDYDIKYSNFKDAFLAHNEYVHDKIRTIDNEDKYILHKALNIILNNTFLIENINTPRLTHFDYCPRNIFVSKEDNRRVLKAVFDYELCRPWDKNADFCHLFLKNFNTDNKYEESFFTGYNSVSSLDENFNKTFDFYMLNLCIGICAWAKSTAPDYYKLALNKINEIISTSKQLKL